MGIASLSDYMPHHTLPIYIKVEPKEFNTYKMWQTYEMRYEDTERSTMKDDDGPFNYAHECMMISEEIVTFGELPGIVMAFLGSSRDAEEAVKRICAGEKKYDDERELSLLVFLRMDKAKEFITEDIDPIPSEFNKEDTEK